MTIDARSLRPSDPRASISFARKWTRDKEIVSGYAINEIPNSGHLPEIVTKPNRPLFKASSFW
jgi:hypothetical protein